jgi:hypothetical protein
MPVKYIQRHRRDVQELLDSLAVRLADEWRSPHQGDGDGTGYPLILVNRAFDNAPSGVIVVWDAWQSDLHGSERMDVVWQAVKKLFGVDAALRLHNVKGLTPEEFQQVKSMYVTGEPVT